LNRYVDKHNLESPQADAKAVDALRRAGVALKEMSQILGIFEKPTEEKSAARDELVPGLVQLLIDLRNEARKSKNFAISDQIRDRLATLNITLEDRKEGTLWRRG
jgi:cysteinyl-tRNA synthetase